MKVMSVEFASLAKDLGVKYFLVSFSDMLGHGACQAGAGRCDRRNE